VSFLPPVTEANRKWWTLVAISFALFVINLDNTVIVVALPDIALDLDTGLTLTEWVVNSYTLVFAVLLLFGGKLADLLGRRMILLGGLVVFEAASIACALADTGTFLVTARSIQGVGAALMLPATLSLVAANFPAAERGLAFGIWAGISALALAIGPLVGGVLVDTAGWPWIFWINVPVGFVGFVAIVALVRESRDESPGQSLDLPGLVTGGVATFAAIFALMEANRYGWGSATIISLFALSVVSVVAFVLVELRRRSPMLDITVFRDPTFAGANLVGFMLMVALFGTLIYVSIFAQDILVMSAIETGAVLMPATIFLMLTAPIGGKLADEIGATGPMVLGMAIFGSGILLVSRLEGDWGFWQLLPGLALAGVGFGLTVPASTTVALARLPDERAGLGSGILNSFRQLGGALGIAVVGAIIAGEVGKRQVGDTDYPAAFMDGASAGLRVVAYVALAGAVVAAILIRPEPSTAAVRPQGESEEAAAI
jgi:EmrB/QacA subfamily drug resistance transporter